MIYYENMEIKFKIIQKSCLRGKARKIGIKEVETEWFAFVDSDVILYVKNGLTGLSVMLDHKSEL